MSNMRRTRNLGKREREARKRHRRGLMFSQIGNLQSGWLKRGHKHSTRSIIYRLAVADVETSAKSAP